MTKIHHTAIIDPSAQLDVGVEVGPYAVVGPNVCIGADTTIKAFVHIYQNVKMGQRNIVYSYAAIGSDPQVRSYVEAGRSDLIIGDENRFYEGCSVSRGIEKFGGVTQLGNNNILMLNAHIGHDCEIGHHNVLVNNCALAGHVTLGHHTTVGASCSIHQFCTVGDYVFISHSAPIVKDIMPYMMVVGNPAKVRGLNIEGLKRAHFPAEVRRKILQAYRVIFSDSIDTAMVIKELSGGDFQSVKEVQKMKDFLIQSKRGITR